MAAVAGVVGAAGGGLGYAARELLHRQAETARRIIGKPLGEQAPDADRVWKPSYGNPVDLLLLGDSIAAGLGADIRKETLGGRLSKALATTLHRSVRLRTGAVVGSESSMLAGQIDALPGDYAADVAVIVVGGNDVTHRVPVADSVKHLEEAACSASTGSTPAPWATSAPRRRCCPRCWRRWVNGPSCPSGTCRPRRSVNPPSLGRMPTVLLATFTLLPEGEYGGEHLVSAFAERDVTARWVTWDDPAVDWSAADLVAVRSTWDYHRRLPEFLAWVRGTEAVAPVLNGADVFAWNADKSYLLELGAEVPVVPTRLLEDHGLVPALQAAIDDFGAVLVKPRTGAGGLGVVLADSVRDPRLEGLTAGPWVAQPVVESVRTEGERSVFVLGGEVISQVDKQPAGGEVRVHEHFGGVSRPVPVEPECAELAAAAVAAGVRLLGRELPYARVDMMRLADGRLAVSELELIEPGLYLDVHPGNAALFADVVVRVLAGRTGGLPDRP